MKPENLLFDEHQNLKIIDFGLCNTTTDGKTLFTGCGSPNYAAPELLLGCGYDGAQIDVWSSGVVLYAMATSQLPFDDSNDNMPVLYQKIKQGKFHMPVELSTELKDLINNLLQPLPIKRYTMQDIWKHPWITGPQQISRFPSQDQHFKVPEYVTFFKTGSSRFEDIQEDLINSLF